MVAAQAVRIARQSQQLEASGRQLDILSYKATLARGYAVVRSGAEVLTTRAQAAAAPALSIEFSDGVLDLDAKEAAQK
jgi:exodeoxyribonuclease VII large subunit